MSGKKLVLIRVLNLVTCKIIESAKQKQKHAAFYFYLRLDYTV